MEHLPPPIVPVARMPKPTAYKNQLKKHMENKFPSISCAAIDAVMDNVGFHYPDANRILSRIENRNDKSMESVRLVFPAMPPDIKVYLKRDRINKKRHFRVTNPMLLRDMGILNDDNEKENKSPTIVAKVNRKNAAKVVQLVECGCCFGDDPLEAMRECTAGQGHLVCKECIYRYVSEQLDGNNSANFKCIIDPNCGCDYHPIKVLGEVLSPSLKRRTDEAIYRSEVEQAGLKGLWTCGTCNNVVGFLDTPAASVLCPICDKAYCTKCKRPYHHKKTCKEMQADEDRKKDPINKAHEKMSEAVTRRCPKCLTPFVKHDGCNKMTCQVRGCGAKSCYLCGVQVQDYSHFCSHKRVDQNVPCFCGKQCELFTSTERMIQRDRMARQKAGRKVLEDTGYTEDEIKEKLKSPDDKKKSSTLKKATPRRPVQPAIVPRAAAAAPMAVAQPEPAAVRAAVQRFAAPPANAQPAIIDQPEGEDVVDEQRGFLRGCIIM